MANTSIDNKTENTATGKIKILMTLGDTSRGGAQTYAVNVLKSIDRERFQIDFAVNYRRDNGYEKEMEAYGSKIHILPKFRGVNYRQYIRAWNEFLSRENYDIIHGHVSSSASLYLREAKRHNCITIAHSHSAGYQGSLFVRIAKWVFTQGARKQADYWFACADLAAKRLFGPKYKKNPNYYDIPNAIDPSRYVFDQTIREKIRASLQIEDDAVLYGHVGAFIPVKNHQFLIDVFEEVYKTNKKNAYLVLLGGGALKEQIEQKVVERNLQDRVIFAGIVGNVQEYMMAMDAIIFPSLFEGVPLVLMEAQAAGLYCVVSSNITDEANLTEYVIPLSLGHDAAHWANVAQNVPEIDRAAMNQVVSETRYNIQRSIETLTKLYQEMYSERIEKLMYEEQQ